MNYSQNHAYILPEWTFSIITAQVFAVIVTDGVIAMFVWWQNVITAHQFHWFWFDVIA